MTMPIQATTMPLEVRLVGLAPPLTPRFISVLWEIKALIIDWYGSDAGLRKLMDGDNHIGYRITVRNLGDFAFLRIWLPERLRQRGIARDAVRIELHAVPNPA